MDKYTEEYLLETQGINGLRLVPRTDIPEEIARKLIKYLEPQSRDNDRRQRIRNGVYTNTEDYMISGEGRSPAIIRELQSDFPGMKKYALIDMRDKYDEKSQGKIKEAVSKLWNTIVGKKNNIPYEPVCFLYSEGLDIEKMISDRTYADMVMDLLDEERLSELRGKATDCYIGTIQKTEDGYAKMIRPNPQAVMTSIRTETTRKQAEDNLKLKQESQKQLEKAKMRVETDRIIHFTESLTPEQAELVMDMIYHKFGKEEVSKMLKGAVQRSSAGTTKTQELIDSGDYVPDDDEQEQ